jgi:hypothetical protein
VGHQQEAKAHGMCRLGHERESALELFCALVLEDGQRGPQDLSDGRHVVAGQTLQKPEQLFGNGGDVVHEIIDGQELHSRGRLSFGHIEHDTDHGTSMEPAEAAHPRGRSCGEGVRHPVGERPGEGNGNGYLCEQHTPLLAQVKAGDATRVRSAPRPRR